MFKNLETDCAMNWKQLYKNCLLWTYLMLVRVIYPQLYHLCKNGIFQIGIMGITDQLTIGK